MAKDKKTVFIFIVTTFIVSLICYWIYFAFGEKASPIAILLMFCPALIAIILKSIYYKKECVLGMKLCKFKFILIGLLIPVLYLGLSYFLFWIGNPSSFIGNFSISTITYFALDFSMNMILSIGEEIGWRGFLITRLNKIYGYKLAIIITGLIWALWHYPAIIGGIYDNGTLFWYQIPMFTIVAILITVIMAQLRFKSNSLWPVIILHASHNYVLQILSSLTKSSSAGYLIGETGFITLLFIIFIIIILNKKVIKI